jgi:hypothetical protein
MASTVPTACRRHGGVVVGDLGEAVEQVMALVGCQRGGALSRWATAGMGEMNRPARSSGGVMALTPT